MSTYPHRIRLRGPWECVDKGSAGNPKRVTVPFQLPNAGEVCLSRKFGYPGQIDFFERVWLTFEDIRGATSISLNSSAVGTATGSGEFDVTPLLKPHNRLEIELAANSGESGLVGEVALEVRCAVFLRNMQAQRAGGELVITGDLVGTWPEPFDLYFFVDDAQVHYDSLQTSGDRTSFSAVVGHAGEPQRPVRLRVDLIQGPTIWARHELTCD